MFFTKPLEIVFEKLVAPVIDEKIRALRHHRNFRTAQDCLMNGDPQRVQEGLAILRELLRAAHVTCQFYYDVLCSFLTERFSRGVHYGNEWNPVIRHTFSILCSLPTHDANGWPYNSEIPNLHLDSITLHCMNFANFVLYDSEFNRVDFSRSSFKNCDLGGCEFLNSSVEWCDFGGAKLNVSFLSHRPTTFMGTRLWGTNLHEADIAKCRIQKIDTDLTRALELHSNTIELV